MMVTLDQLIKEGREIRIGIKYVKPPQNIIRTYSLYTLSNSAEYANWKNTAVRYLDIKYPNNRCSRDFETAIKSFEDNHYSPVCLDDAIGVLVSCKHLLNDSLEEQVQMIYNLEHDYEDMSYPGMMAGDLETRNAFSMWYDSLIGLLGKYYDESNSLFRQLLFADTKGKGLALRDVYFQIKPKANYLLDNLLRPNRINQMSLAPSQANKSDKIFIVHGHDNEMKESVARTIQSFGLEPIILSEQPDGGRTIIEKFEDESDVNFAVVLMSDKDDVGAEVGSTNYRHRARQNVILELGYFIGKLGRKSHVCVLKKGNVEAPSDILGVIYKPFDSQSGSWKYELGKELRIAGYDVDLNKI